MVTLKAQMSKQVNAQFTMVEDKLRREFMAADEAQYERTKKELAMTGVRQSGKWTMSSRSASLRSIQRWRARSTLRKNTRAFKRRPRKKDRRASAYSRYSAPSHSCRRSYFESIYDRQLPPRLRQLGVHQRPRSCAPTRAKLNDLRFLSRMCDI